MFWKRWTERFWGETPGEAMRRQHSAWLTEAFASGKRYPRIPIKPVSQGGWSRLMTREFGQAHAAQWWRAALERVDG